MAYNMYMNNGEFLHNNQNTNNLLVPHPEPFSRSISDAATNNTDNNKQQPHPNDDINGIRMKRYNSLPDVAEYLDPNSYDQSKSSVMNNNANNPQFNSLMDAFGQSQVDRKNFKPNFEHQVMPDPRLSAGHLSTPMSNNFSTSSSAYQPSPNLQSPQTSLQNQSETSHLGWNSSVPSSQPFVGNSSYDGPGFISRKRPSATEDSLMNYPNSQLGYPNEPMSNLTNMDMLHPSPHFPQPPMYMPQDMFKPNRPDNPMNPGFGGYVNPYEPNAARDGFVIPVQPAPAPDPATTQAANEAIASSSQLPPPSEDNGDPDQVPRRQHLRYQGDLYTPQWVRGAGHKKEGYCDLCSPGKWLQLKNSAFWYHKQFFHGISSVSGKFFSGPLQTRQKDPDVVEGLCHQCQQWIQMSSPKRRNSVLWFRHAHKCHVYHKPKNVYGKKE